MAAASSRFLRKGAISRPATPTKAKQKDLFDSYELPSLDLLADPPPDTAPKLLTAPLLVRSAKCHQKCPSKRHRRQPATPRSRC